MKSLQGLCRVYEGLVWAMKDFSGLHGFCTVISAFSVPDPGI